MKKNMSKAKGVQEESSTIVSITKHSQVSVIEHSVAKISRATMLACWHNAPFLPRGHARGVKQAPATTEKIEHSNSLESWAAGPIIALVSPDLLGLAAFSTDNQVSMGDMRAAAAKRVRLSTLSNPGMEPSLLPLVSLEFKKLQICHSVG